MALAAVSVALNRSSPALRAMPMRSTETAARQHRTRRPRTGLGTQGSPSPRGLTMARVAHRILIERNSLKDNLAMALSAQVWNLASSIRRLSRAPGLSAPRTVSDVSSSRASVKSYEHQARSRSMTVTLPVP